MCGHGCAVDLVERLASLMGEQVEVSTTVISIPIRENFANASYLCMNILQISFFFTSYSERCHIPYVITNTKENFICVDKFLPTRAGGSFIILL